MEGTKTSMSSSPFPGMDPYLESVEHWAILHHELITCLYQGLLPGLVDRYRARVGQRSYFTQHALLTSLVREEHHEEYIEIRQRGETKITTLIELIGPANKTTPEGRDAYKTKRQDSKAGGANTVEIDLILQGQSLFDSPSPRLPVHDYAVVVTRPSHPDRPEVWTGALPKRLPQFKLPLARNDRDLMVDLQNALARCYDRMGFAARIDYRRDPNTPLSAEAKQWLDELLRDQKLR
jgi:hypothetical protein